MTLKRYRKKPVVITAIQWTGDNADELSEWTGGRFRQVDLKAVGGDPEITASVLDDLHSTWVGMKTGQHVIQGVQGEFYPCADDVLQATYDPA